MADEAGDERSEVRPGAQAPTGGAPRLVTANRQQLQFRSLDLESLLPPEHRARAVWAVVEQLELKKEHASVERGEHSPDKAPS